ncbi:MAG: phage protein Gp36 family protein [bacterium]
MSSYTTSEFVRAHLPPLTIEVSSDSFISDMIETASDIIDSYISSIYITPLSEPYDAIITHTATFLSITLVLSSIYTEESETAKRLLETMGKQAYDLLEKISEGRIPLKNARLKDKRKYRLHRDGLKRSDKGPSQFYIPNEAVENGGD